MSTKVAVIGAAGRMGRALVRCLTDESVAGLELTGAIDRQDCPDLGKDAGRLAGVTECGVAVSADLAAVAATADVLVDFSFHTTAGENARRVAEQGKCLVVGTTGLSGDEEAMLTRAAEKIAIVYAPNMSLGMNLLFSLVTRAARALKGQGYDVEIIERHHRRKKDAPSGTALGLGRAVAEGLELDLDTVAVHGRSGLVGERPLEQIGFHAVRGGDIVGDHTVVFAADGESVELAHHATTRDTFALGALRAAAWVVDKDAGLYTMRDVLGL